MSAAWLRTVLARPRRRGGFPVAPQGQTGQTVGMDDQESNLDTSAAQDVAVTEGSMMSDTTRAARRMSFNADALTYQRGRPRYPDAVFDLLTRALRAAARCAGARDRCRHRSGNRAVAGGRRARGRGRARREPGRDPRRRSFACDRLEITVATSRPQTCRRVRPRGGGDVAALARPGHIDREDRRGWYVRAAGWRRGGTSSATPTDRRSSATGSMRSTTTCCPPILPATGTAARTCSTPTAGAGS